jgi:hypothetical protein
MNNNRIGLCSICLEENIDLIKWGNNECTHWFCAPCTERCLEQHFPLCPLCRRPDHGPQLQQHQHQPGVAAVWVQRQGLIHDVTTICMLIFNIFWTTLAQVWHFTQTNNPLQFLYWVVAISTAHSFYAVYFTIVCEAHVLPNVLNFYNSNNMVAMSLNISDVKAMFVYFRNHTQIVDLVCRAVMK